MKKDISEVNKEILSAIGTAMTLTNDGSERINVEQETKLVDAFYPLLDNMMEKKTDMYRNELAAFMIINAMKENGQVGFFAALREKMEVTKPFGITVPNTIKRALKDKPTARSIIFGSKARQEHAYTRLNVEDMMVETAKIAANKTYKSNDEKIDCQEAWDVNKISALDSEQLKTQTNLAMINYADLTNYPEKTLCQEDTLLNAKIRSAEFAL